MKGDIIGNKKLPGGCKRAGDETCACVCAFSLLPWSRVSMTINKKPLVIFARGAPHLAPLFLPLYGHCPKYAGLRLTEFSAPGFHFLSELAE